MSAVKSNSSAGIGQNIKRAHRALFRLLPVGLGRLFDQNLRNGCQRVNCKNTGFSYSFAGYKKSRARRHGKSNREERPDTGDMVMPDLAIRLARKD